MYKKFLAFFLLIPLYAVAQTTIPSQTMQHIYDEVKTPFKYGLVVSPEDNGHKIDCPMIYREKGRWYMTYVVYNGKDGLDGRGYETWLATSDDLLHWQNLGRLLSYAEKGWDMNQRAGYPSLIDWTWNGSYAMKKYKGRHWMSYFGGIGTGYEAVRAPLNIGIASTRGDITIPHEWENSETPVLSINDKDAQWWEKMTHYKSTVYYDAKKSLGHRFVMFYNAGGVNPDNNLKAERIGIALSDDMKHFTRLPLRTSPSGYGNPVFYHEAPGVITGDAQIVSMDSLYVMFYFSAYNPTRKYNAYNTFAVSRDLIHWQDWEGTDLIYPSKPYDDMFAHKSYVMKHDGVVYHFYCAVNKGGQRGIAVATSVPMGRSEVKFPTPEEKGRRKTITLNDDWKACLVKTNQKEVYGDTLTHSITLPHNFDDYYGYRQLRHGNLHGTARYEKHFTCSPLSGKRYFLNFEGIGTYATVTLNGHRFQRVPVGRTTYTLDVTDQLYAGDNNLIVDVEHPDMITDMPWVCGGCSSEWGFSEGSQPFGIFRPVSLIATSETRIEPYGVHVWNNAACDSVFIDTEVKNYAADTVKIQVVNKLNHSNGKQYFRLAEEVTLAPGQTTILHQHTAVNNPHRWNLEDPYLYTLVSMIKDDKGKTIDEVSTEYGIRSISWPLHRKDDPNDSRQFLLNGNPVFINGTCDYEHLFGQSHAFSHEQISSRVKKMRQTGFNAFREAHQPHNLHYQHLLDNQGMLFWSQFSAHIWYDTPQFRDNFKHLLRQWVKERRNSPSLILWGLQNESVLPRDFAEECTNIIREMDPTAINQRAVTTCNGGEGTDWNVVQNWSGTYGGKIANYGEELKRPDQLLNGEYGAWRTLGLRGSDKYSEDNFCSILKQKSILAKQVSDSVCGHFQWIFVSHENPGRVQPDESLRRIDKVGPFNYKGLFTPWEQPTEAFYMYRNLFADSTASHHIPTAADRNRDIIKADAGCTYIYRVNCGGDEYTDTYNQKWSQDSERFSTSWSQPFGLSPFMASQGHIIDSIHGTADAPLFSYFRYGRHRLKYTFPVPEGKYRIELYFAEPWLGARYGSNIDCEGERIFDVAIGSKTVIEDLDLWAEAGYAGAYKKVVYADAEDGKITISFPEVKVGEAVISAIAIATDKPVAMSMADTSRSLPSNYWSNLDTDTIARTPKSALPTDTEAFPAVRYTVDNTLQQPGWTITPGIAREYMFRFRYRNTKEKDIDARIKVTDSSGTILVNRSMTFPKTPRKFKTISTTTGTQINAGTYRVTLENAEDVEFEYLEVQ